MTGSGCFPTRPRPGRRQRTGPGWRRPSSTWSPSSCAGANCRWSTCPDRRWSAPERGRQFPAPLPQHPRSHASDARTGDRRGTVAVPPARLRHDLELSRANPPNPDLSTSLFVCCREIGPSGSCVWITDWAKGIRSVSGVRSVSGACACRWSPAGTAGVIPASSNWWSTHRRPVRALPSGPGLS